MKIRQILSRSGLKWYKQKPTGVPERLLSSQQVKTQEVSFENLMGQICGICLAVSFWRDTRGH